MALFAESIQRRMGIEAPQQVPLFPPHFPPLFRSPFVVVAEQVEQTVNQEPGDLLIKRSTVVLRLPAGGLERDDNIPQHRIVTRNRLSLLLGKGKHIRGTVDAPVLPVQ